MTYALFLFNSVTLGVGLAMDAFSVSVVNGINETSMSKTKAFKIAGVYSFFQALMTLIGWLCTHTIIMMFDVFQKWVPWIALIILSIIGIKMIIEGKTCVPSNNEIKRLCPHIVLLQGIATSIDALSVGLTIADYNLIMALVCAFIISFVTLIICLVGVELGKKIGIEMAEEATIFGGIILILVGIEIWLHGIL